MRLVSEGKRIANKISIIGIDNVPIDWHDMINSQNRRRFSCQISFLPAQRFFCNIKNNFSAKLICFGSFSPSVSVWLVRRAIHMNNACHFNLIKFKKAKRFNRIFFAVFNPKHNQLNERKRIIFFSVWAEKFARN